MGLRLSTSHPAPQSLAPRGFIGRDASVPVGELRSSAGHTSHLVAWIRQESSRIRYLWRLTASEVSSLFSGLAYPGNKVTNCNTKPIHDPQPETARSVISTPPHTPNLSTLPRCPT